jgi:hypothetical protein
MTMNKTFRLMLLGAALAGLAASPAQSPEIANLMRAKLDRSQKILEAVVTSNWVQLESQAGELERMTNDPRWTVLKYPEYARHSSAFVRAVQELRAAAVKRDLDQAPKSYVAVTMQCVECHRYLARARIAK